MLDESDSLVSYCTGFFVSYKGKIFFITSWFNVTGREASSYHYHDRTNKKRTPIRLSIYVPFKGDTLTHRVDFVTQRTTWLEYFDENGFTYDVIAAELPNRPPREYLNVIHYAVDELQSRTLQNGEKFTAIGYSQTSIYAKPMKMKLEVFSYPNDQVHLGRLMD